MEICPSKSASESVPQKTASNNVAFDGIELVKDSARKESTSGSGSGVGSADKAEVTLKEDLGWMGILAAGFSINNSWLTTAAALLISLQYGPMTTVWGIVATTPIYLCIGLTLAELLSAYPTTGGQYHWTWLLAPASIKAAASYSCGILSWFAWVCLASSANSGSVLVVAALVDHVRPGVAMAGWQNFVVFEAGNVVGLVVNLFGKHVLSSLYTLALVLSVAAFVAVSVTTVAMADARASSAAVWTSDYGAYTGWPVGVQFLVALAAPIMAFCPVDGAVHLVAEVRDAPRVVPRTIITALVVSSVTSLAFALATLYAVTDVTALLLSSQSFVVFAVWLRATRSSALAIFFSTLTLVLMLVATVACVQVISLMTWSLARDGGLPGRARLALIHPRLNAPVWPLLWNFAVISLIGALFFVSPLAYNSIVGISVILQQIVILIPVALLLYHRRADTVLPRNRAFCLPAWLGWTANTVTLGFTLAIPPFLVLPARTPTTPSYMNYSSVVLVGVILMAAINWFVFARHRFKGPAVITFHHG